MIVNRGKYYLYRYIRLDKNEPFYIGIGTKKDKTHSKVKTEYCRAFVKHTENNILLKIIAKTDYEVEILLESDDYEFIKQKEIEFIALYGRINKNTGCLSNLTDGGEGVKGRIPTLEWRKNQSEFMKSKPVLTGENHPSYGIKQSEEWVEKELIVLGVDLKQSLIKIIYQKVIKTKSFQKGIKTLCLVNQEAYHQMLLK